MQARVSKLRQDGSVNMEPQAECSWKDGGHAYWMMGKTGVLARGPADKIILLEV